MKNSKTKIIKHGDEMIQDMINNIPEEKEEKNILEEKKEEKEIDILHTLDNIIKLADDKDNIKILKSSLKRIIRNLKDKEKSIEEKEKEIALREETFKRNEEFLDEKISEFDRSKKEFVNQQSKMRNEDDKLRGLSKVDKILTLIEDLKNSIIVENNLEKMIREEFKFVDFTISSKKIMREFGDYEMSVLDAKSCQAKINLILKYLTILMDSATKGGKRMSNFEERSFFKARGILKAFHFRLNFIDNHLHSHESKPLELMRIFSALEPTITSLSALDDDSLESEDYDKVVKSFKSFIEEERIAFMRTYFEDSYIEKLDAQVKKNVFIRLLNSLVLNPTQVLDQITRWESVNQSFRKKFLEFLSVELTPTEQITVAKKEIDNMREKGVI